MDQRGIIEGWGGAEPPLETAGDRPNGIGDVPSRYEREKADPLAAI
jgi:hypothetical protein